MCTLSKIAGIVFCVNSYEKCRVIRPNQNSIKKNAYWFGAEICNMTHESAIVIWETDIVSRNNQGPLVLQNRWADTDDNSFHGYQE